MISGTPGSGKSTISAELCGLYAKAIHIPVDDLRHFVRSGLASAQDPWTDETTSQFALARRTAGGMARDYGEHGFTVVIDDVTHEEDLYQYELDRSARKVLLSPALEVALERNRTRADRDVKGVRDDTVRRLHAHLLERCRPEAAWVVIDSSTLSPRETVEKIVAHYR